MGLFDFFKRKKNSLNINETNKNYEKENQVDNSFIFKTVEREDHSIIELDWLDKLRPIYIDTGETKLHTDVLYTDDGLSVFINVKTEKKANLIVEAFLTNNKSSNFNKEIVDEYDLFYVGNELSIGYRETIVGLYQVDIISKQESDKPKGDNNNEQNLTYDLNEDEDYLELLNFLDERPNIKRIYNEFKDIIRNNFSVRQYLIEANLMKTEEVKNIAIWSFSNIIGFLEAILEKNENYEIRLDLDALIEALDILNEEKREKLFNDWGISDNELYWIDVIDMRVRSMPFTFNSNKNKMTFHQSLDELGKEHCEEYKFGEYRVPENKRNEVALERIQGFFSIRDYIQSEGNNEQKFHLDASLIGALLYASSLVNINEDILRFRTLSSKINSDILSNLFDQIKKKNKTNNNSEFNEIDKTVNNFDDTDVTLPFNFYISGSMKSNLEDFEGAVIDFSKAIELDPNNSNVPIYFCSRGNSKFGLGKYKDAIEDYNNAIQIEPNYPDAYLKRANAYEKLNNHEESNKDFERYSACEDNDRAYDYYDENEYQEGINLVIKSLEIMPNIAGFWDTLSLGYYYLGDYKSAIEASDKCIQLDNINSSQNPEHYVNRAKIYIKLKNIDNAVKDLKIAIELDPDYEEAMQLLETTNN
jgi:tetratricopeptide (TPR) repeat protein